MSSTTATAAAATSTKCGSPAQYELPVKDAACGVPNKSEYESIFNKCAKPAGIRAYNNDCALYALAVDQSVQRLTDCLYDDGVKWEDVWCTGSVNATATSTDYPTPTGTATKTSAAKPSETASSPKKDDAESGASTAMAVQGPFRYKSALALLGLVVTGLFV
ncbi:hypothetical protein PISL3812_04209 [Talaromyces islandicus]|uniref:Uncharacterized protein n=1 Tax=Talaromyces islandicus TaxID=28573 RepID=A0A0U1LVR7_TALIS|nr:hypothetical protein PISL3812_04209 [Talaromyces islandicus]